MTTAAAVAVLNGFLAGYLESTSCFSCFEVNVLSLVFPFNRCGTANGGILSLFVQKMSTLQC